MKVKKIDEKEFNVPSIVETVFDKIYYTVRDRKAVNLEDIVKELNLKNDRAEEWAKILAKKGLIEVYYPVVGKAQLKILREENIQEEKAKAKNITERYVVIADNVPALVTIDTQSGDLPMYEISIPKLGPGTNALLNHLIDKLARNVEIKVDEIIDPKKILRLKEKFFENAEREFRNILPNSDKTKLLSGILLHKMYGLGDIDIILSDDWLEEIAVNNSSVPIAIYHKKFGWLQTTKRMVNEEEIYNLSSQIGRKVGREITSLNPIMDAHLLSGDRVAATLFPISSSGNTITIRKFARIPWTVIHLISPEYRTLSKEIAAFLWQALQYELNIMVAGGTAAGKTSILNSICALIPATQRIISIEDTRELSLPKILHWNWIPMTTRKANPEGQGEVSMLDLIVSSLRMRPDRIIVGEVRRRKEAETMFEAMHTGHSVYTTMHADTVAQLKRRLLEPPIEIPKSEVEALQLLLVQYRDRRKNLRRTLELAEILRGGQDLQINYLYRWRPRIDVFEKVNESIRVVEDLNLHTGMTNREIKDDLEEKQVILQWMLDNNIKNVDQVGKVMRLYYKNPGLVAEAAKKNKKPSGVL